MTMLCQGLLERRRRNRKRFDVPLPTCDDASMARPKWDLQISWRAKASKAWWSDPDLIVTAFPEHADYAVAVELRMDEGGPFVTGIAVRRHPWKGWQGERTHVSPRDVQRLPLARIVGAALAAAAIAERPPVDEEGRPIPQPVAGRPGWTSTPLDGSLGGEIAYDPGEDSRFSDGDPPGLPRPAGSSCRVDGRRANGRPSSTPTSPTLTA